MYERWPDLPQIINAPQLTILEEALQISAVAKNGIIGQPDFYAEVIEEIPDFLTKRERKKLSANGFCLDGYHSKYLAPLGLRSLFRYLQSCIYFTLLVLYRPYYKATLKRIEV
jgi:hypothetical protein